MYIMLIWFCELCVFESEQLNKDSFHMKTKKANGASYF